MPTRLTAAINTISIVIGLVTASYSFFLLPYRMKLSEDAIIAIQHASQADHELLVRIDERTERTAEWIKRHERILP